MRSSISPQEAYERLGRLVESMPELVPLTPEVHKWLADAHAVVKLVDVADATLMKMTIPQLSDRRNYPWAAVEQIRSAVFRALSIVELQAPVASRGAFIPAASPHDAFAAIAAAIRPSTKDVLIVDPYLDANATEFVALANEGVSVRLLADAADHKPALIPAVRKWNEQYAPSRLVECRLAPSKKLHDRLIISDNDSVWTLTQSLNAFAARSPASVIRDTTDIADRKKEFFREMWEIARTA